MLDFHVYVSRLGEFGVQALIERLERYEGLPAVGAVSLEDRWNFVMAREPAQVGGQQLAA